MSGKNPYQHIWDMMHEVRIAMVVTHCGDEEIRSRPMFARPDADEDAIYFLTDADLPKDQEIQNNSQVCLTFADPKAERYVSVTGAAEVYADVATVSRIWSAADKAFWKNAEDPRIRVIRVTPEQGEYWEGPGLVASAVKMVIAAASGARPHFPESKKVAM